MFSINNSFLIEKKVNMNSTIIDDIRNMLFLNKTKKGMKSYNQVKKWLLSNPNIYDIYTNEKIVDTNTIYNIEHTIPAQIMIIKPINLNTKLNNSIFLNTEPYSDPHILFPTLVAINSLRSNYIFGDIDDRHFFANKVIDDNIVKIIKDNKITNERGITLSPSLSPSLSPLPSYDIDSKTKIYIADGCKEMRFPYFNSCKIGNCMFEPKEETSGTIARIIFYYFLMYGYNSTKRPYTNNEPWMIYNNNYYEPENEKYKKCDILNFSKWKIFFYDNFYYYYYASKNNPPTELEHNRNKEIIAFSGVPNIFIGYIDKSGKYVYSTHNIIDEFFGFKEIGIDSEILLCLNNCQIVATTNTKIYKYLYCGKTVDKVECNNIIEIMNYNNQQQKELSQLSIYSTNDLYKHTYNYLNSVITNIEPYIILYFPKQIEEYKETMENMNNKILNLQEQVSKKQISIIADAKIAEEMIILYRLIFQNIELIKKFSGSEILYEEHQKNINSLNTIITTFQTVEIFEKSLENVIDVSHRENTTIITNIVPECAKEKHLLPKLLPTLPIIHTEDRIVKPTVKPVEMRTMTPISPMPSNPSHPLHPLQYKSVSTHWKKPSKTDEFSQKYYIKYIKYKIKYLQLKQYSNTNIINQ
jgi:endonuclease I